MAVYFYLDSPIVLGVTVDFVKEDYFVVLIFFYFMYFV